MDLARLGKENYDVPVFQGCNTCDNYQLTPTKQHAMDGQELPSAKNQDQDHQAGMPLILNLENLANRMC